MILVLTISNYMAQNKVFYITRLLEESNALEIAITFFDRNDYVSALLYLGISIGVATLHFVHYIVVPLQKSDDLNLQVTQILILLAYPVQFWSIYKMYFFVAGLYHFNEKLSTNTKVNLRQELSEALYSHIDKSLNLEKYVSLLKWDIVFQTMLLGIVTGVLIQSLVMVWSIQHYPRDGERNKIPMFPDKRQRQKLLEGEKKCQTSVF